VRRTVTDEQGIELAPDEDPVPPPQPLTRGRAMVRLLDKVERKQKQKAANS